MTPNAAWQQALQEKRNRHRPVSAVPLLNLHLAFHVPRQLNADYTLDFPGKHWPVTPVPNKIVTVVHHPGQRFWVIPQPPHPAHPVWPDVLAHHQL